MMAFNYMNTGSPGRYPYPMHLIQQMDLSMSLPPGADLTNLMNTSNMQHSNPVSQQMPTGLVDLSNSNGNPRGLTNDFGPINRSGPELSLRTMSSVADNLPIHPLSGQYNQSFQHFSNQTQALSPINYQPPQIENRVADPSRGWINKEHQPLNTRKPMPQVLNNVPAPNTSSAKARRRKRGKKAEKEKKSKKAHFIKSGCSTNCQRRCKQKISQETREDLFNEYWNLEEDNQRKEFIAQHAIKMPMMTCKEGSRRSFSVDWAFNIRGESYSVCKLFFLDTLDVSEEMAYSAVKDSHFCSNETPVIQITKRQKRKPTWFETDIDDYTIRKANETPKSKPRYEAKKEKITEMRPGCTDACRRNCQSKFQPEERLSIFEFYRSLSNVRKQREFISHHVKRLERKYAKADKVTRRGCSMEWLLPLRGEEIPVCKTFFLHTVGISEHIAYSAGLQNEIQPAVKQKPPKRERHPPWSALKCKYIKALIAKGRLKAHLKNNLKKSKVLGDALSKAEVDLAAAESYQREENALSVIGFQKDEKELNSDFYRGDENGLRKTENEDSYKKGYFKPRQAEKIQPQTAPFQDMSAPQQGQSSLLHMAFPQTNLPCGPVQGGMPNQYNMPAPGTRCNHPNTFNQQPMGGLGNNSMDHFYQQPDMTSMDMPPHQSHPSHPHHNPKMPMANDLQATCDALLLQTLKSTTGDLFPCKGPKGKRRKRDPSMRKEKMKMPRVKKVRVKAEKPFNKRVKEGCSDTCRRQCNQKIPFSARQELFNEFWSLEDDVCRREYVLPIVNKIPKKSGKNSESRRGCTIEWAVPYNGELQVVCKKFFLDTFDITENFVKTVHDKIERNEGSMEDMRGRHHKRSSLFLKEQKEVEKYIKALATYRAVRCVRCNRDFPRWCLNSNIPLNQLYKEYADGRKGQDVRPVCRTSFTSLCFKKFNIKNGVTQENICYQCSVTSQASEEVASVANALINM